MDRDITRLTSTDLAETMAKVERAIEMMNVFCDAIPAPAILYSTKDYILWYNIPMNRVLYGHNGRIAAHAKTKNEVLNYHIDEVLTEEAASYIKKQNAIVRETKKPQYDYFTSNGVSHKWTCLRFIVERTRVGSILLPSVDDVDFFLADNHGR